MSVVVLPLHSCFNVGVVVVAFAWLLLLPVLLAAASDPLPATSTGSRTGKQAATEDALEPELDSLRQLGSAFAGANIEDVIQGLLLLHRGGCSDQAGEPSQLRWHGELESFKLHIGCTSSQGPGNVVQRERPGLCVDPLCQNALVVVGVAVSLFTYCRRRCAAAALLLVDNGDTGNCEEEGREEKQARDVGLQYLAQDGLWVATLASREEKAQSLLLGQNSERHSSLSCCHALLVAALTGSSEC